MIDSIKTPLKPLASLRITVGLLLISMVLVLAGTTAQRDMGVQDVQHQFFHAWWSKIYVHYFLPAPKAGHVALESLPSAFPRWFPLPGGYTLIVAMLVNLLAAHTVRFKLRWNRTGIIMIHSGLILLLVGEFVTSMYAVEAQMRLDVGGSANYADDIRSYELAVTDPSPADHDNVTVIASSLLADSVGKAPIHDAKLPFDVKVERWYDNSDIAGPNESGKDVERLANAGSAQSIGVHRLAKYPGSEAEKIDLPSAFVTFSKNGQSLGTYLTSIYLNHGMVGMPALEKAQEVTVDGKTYQFTLRFRRDYKPYTVELHKFTHEVFLGTDEAKNFASNIQLIDPAHHVNRSVRIWMNHPLRYNGETFYQQNFANHDQTSILQIVHNPAWLWPYFACAIGGLGLALHFGIKLFGFLSKTLAPGAGTVGAARQPPPVPGRGDKGSSKSKRFDSSGPDRYTLSPAPKWPGVVLAMVMVAIGATFLVGWTSFSYPSDKYNWDEFGKLPISYEGRIQPLQSLATNTLKVISGRGVVHDENKELESPSKWILDCMSQSGNWADCKVFRVDHDQVKDSLGLATNERYFSWNDLFPKNGKNQEKFQAQIKLAQQVPAKERDIVQSQILDLASHVNMVARLQQVSEIREQVEFESDPSRQQTMMHALGDAIMQQDPQFLQRMRAAGDMERAQQLFDDAVVALDRSTLTSAQQAAFKEWALQKFRQRDIERMPVEANLFLSAPLKPNEKWQPLAAALPVAGGGTESSSAFLKIIGDYQGGNAADFNADVAGYRTRLDAALPSEMTKVGTETFFNRLDPFFVSMLLYIAVFLATAFSWLGLGKPLRAGALALISFTLLVHMTGLGFRVYLTAHGPVTNLYSSAVFIGMIIVMLSIGLELIYHNGIGLAAGSLAGYASLQIAAGLASVEGDTMKQVVAVLDTNFWLWTHVTCVTIGYASTFLAGVLAIAYIGASVALPGFNKEGAKTLSRMIYGIVCFAMLFSFVGTILGGIWADQSWGRFWGWDPKENGAVLIVVWNAMILHARWGGMVRERGVAVLAVLGNIVTSWSWFGTNMLGIGLHSYGFMNSAQFWLITWMLSQTVIAVVGMLPQKWWASSVNKNELPRRVLPV